MTLSERLNLVLPTVTHPDFLSGAGLGNEIACHIFDYPAQSELEVRAHLATMRSRLATHHSDLDVLHLDLLDVIIAYLTARKLFENVLKAELRDGDSKTIHGLKGPVTAEKVVAYIVAQHKPAERDLILISGVGSAWPVLRAHNLLNCLHPVIGEAPLVMFYPGSYDGATLRLFGTIAASVEQAGTASYYRAFPLVRQEPRS